MSELRERIEAVARSYLRTPYHHQGRLPGVGLDCVGLPICVGRELGLVAPDFDVQGYDRRPDGVSLLAECEKYFGPRVAKDEMQRGDVLVIRYGEDPQHMGIVARYHAGGLSLIHALGQTDGKGRVVEHRVTDDMLHKFVRAYKMPGVDD